MAKIGAKYYYKEHTYVAKNYTKVKTATGWVDGIDYQRENEPNGPIFTRGLKQFNERFTPYVLSEGDEIAVITMGRLQAVATVKSIEEGVAYCENGSFKMDVKVEVDAEHNGMLEVVGWKPQASDVYFHTHAIRIQEAKQKAEEEFFTAIQEIKDIMPKMDTAQIIQVSNILSSLSGQIKETLEDK